MLHTGEGEERLVPGSASHPPLLEVGLGAEGMKFS